MQRQQEETTKAVERLEKNVENTKSRRRSSVEDEHVDRMARDLDHQLSRTVNQIGREYDRNYYYMGQRFAEGDSKSHFRCSTSSISKVADGAIKS